MKALLICFMMSLVLFAAALCAKTECSLITMFCETRPGIVVCEYNPEYEDLCILCAVAIPNGYKLLVATEKLAFFIIDEDVDFESGCEVKFWKKSCLNNGEILN